MAKLKSGTRIYGTASIDTSVVVGSAVTLSSSGIQVSGISTLNNVNVTQLNVSGVTTSGTLNVGVGGTIITTTGIGSVGIGTTNPRDIVEINSLNNTDVKLRLANSASSFNNFSVIRSRRVSDSQSSLEFQVNNAGIKTSLIIGHDGTVTIGEQSSTKLTVIGNSTNQSNLLASGSLLNVYSNTALAADAGGSITLGGIFNTSSGSRPFAVIKGYKENATDSDFKGYLSFLTNTGSSLSEALRITGIGSVGIGTINPQYPLQVQGNARITGAVYDSTNSPGTSGQVLQSTVTGTQWATATGGSVTISDDTTTNATRYPVFEDVTSGTSASMNVSSTKLTFNPSTGTLSSTIFTSLSDETQKENIRPIENAIEIVSQMNGVRYDWKDGHNTGSVGVIAQEIEKVLPEVVNTNDMGLKTVSYGNIVGVLIEAIKEQQVRIEELERRI